jgi:hypothetical protein
MRRRLMLFALLVLWSAGTADAQIASEGTVRGVVRDARAWIVRHETANAAGPSRRVQKALSLERPGRTSSRVSRHERGVLAASIAEARQSVVRCRT